MKLGVRCIVQKSRPSLNVKLKGQGHRGQKRKVRHFVQESSTEVRSSCGRFFGSSLWGRGYAGWKMSACCWVTCFIVFHCLVAMWATHTHTHNRFTALFLGPPGWAGARRELLNFMAQGKINRGRHTDHLAGCHSIRTNQRPPPPSPHIFYRPDALLVVQPTASKHWRQLAHSD